MNLGEEQAELLLEDQTWGRALYGAFLVGSGGGLLYVAGAYPAVWPWGTLALGVLGFGALSHGLARVLYRRTVRIDWRAHTISYWPALWGLLGRSRTLELRAIREVEFELDYKGDPFMLVVRTKRGSAMELLHGCEPQILRQIAHRLRTESGELVRTHETLRPLAEWDTDSWDPAAERLHDALGGQRTFTATSSDGKSQELPRIMNKDRVFMVADRSIRKGELDKAVAEYEKWLLSHPDDWEIVRHLAGLCVRIGHRERAVEYYLRLAKHYAENPGENKRKAQSVYKIILRIDPEQEEARHALGTG